MNDKPKSLKRRMFEMIWTRAQPSPESTARLVDFLVPIVKNTTRYGDLHFWCPGGRTVGRAKTALTKERDTISWIDSLSDGEIFWDIGACIGGFSCYAAKKGLKVTAFEPSPLNYAVLAKNIEINQLSINTLCVALSDRTALEELRMPKLGFGEAEATFEDFDLSVDPVSVTSMCYRLDDLCAEFNLNAPNFIKIDVDGAEHNLVAGAMNLLSSKEVMEIQVEIDRRRDAFDAMKDRMKRVGFRIAEKQDLDFGKEHGSQRKAVNVLFVRKAF